MWLADPEVGEVLVLRRVHAEFSRVNLVRERHRLHRLEPTRVYLGVK